MKFLFVWLLVPLLIIPAYAESQTLPTENSTLDVKLEYDTIEPNMLSKVHVEFINPQTQKIQVHIDYTLVISNENGEIVGELVSDKKFDVIVFENSFPNEQFIVSTTNLGDKPVNVFVGVKDVKELGTYIDSPEAWWFLIPPSNILGGLGVVILLTGAIMFVGMKRKNKKSAYEKG